LYKKSNGFHTSQRTWYLPIAPTPDHPDALSKKTRKQFPTLELAGGSTLQRKSYVNIRYVYKIKIELLRPYTKPEAPDIKTYQFEESVIRMLAKGKALTMYGAGPQFGDSLARSSLDQTPSADTAQATTAVGPET
jgi:hypothetical protein